MERSRIVRTGFERGGHAYERIVRPPDFPNLSFEKANHNVIIYDLKDHTAGYVTKTTRIYQKYRLLQFIVSVVTFRYFEKNLNLGRITSVHSMN